MNENLVLTVDQSENGYYFFILKNIKLGAQMKLPYNTKDVDTMKAQKQYYCDFFNCDSE
jgi:hypothetical protein